MSILSLSTFTPLSPAFSPSPFTSFLYSHSLPVEDRTILISRTKNRFLAPPFAHSNPKILKTNRRSRYGEPLSVYDSDGEEKNDGVDGEEDDEDDDDIDWFSDNILGQEEFAEPADKDAGRKRSELLVATKIRRESQRQRKFVGSLKTDVTKKLEGNNPLKKKYSQLQEEFVIDRRSIPLLDYLSTFGLSESHLIRMYERHMPSFKINVCSARERLEYLLNVGVKHKDIKKILLRQPQILEYTVENNLKSHVAFLVDLGIPDSRIGQIITAAPSLFSYSVENSLKPTVRYLIEVVGIKKHDLVKVVQLSAQILVQPVDVSWNERYKFLSKELGAPRDSVVKMITKHPQLLHYSIQDGLLPRINFLRSIGMDNSDMLKVLTSLPQVFSLSLKANLKPKCSYLINELQHEVKSLTKYPMYLSLSLDQRIWPRHKFLVFLEKASEGPFPLGSLLPTDECFCQQWAGTSVEKYFTFRQNLMLKEFAKKYEKQG
ncbi:hypothetical protein Ancab_025020 [Ancistrocladus abbreviatus]